MTRSQKPKQLLWKENFSVNVKLLKGIEDVQWRSFKAQGGISVEALGLNSRNMDYWH